MKWKFIRSDFVQVAQDIRAYSQCDFTVSQFEMSPSNLWKNTINYFITARTFVGYIFSLIGCGAPVEALFSSLLYSKPSDNLKIIGSVRKYLKGGETKKSDKRTRDATNGVNPNLDDELFPASYSMMTMWKSLILLKHLIKLS